MECSFCMSDIHLTNFTCYSDQIRCKNGACVDQEFRCLYDEDVYGLLTGCRDASHLENCGKLHLFLGMQRIKT